MFYIDSCKNYTFSLVFVYASEQCLCTFIHRIKLAASQILRHYRALILRNLFRFFFPLFIFHQRRRCAPLVTGLVPFALLPGALYNESNEAECSQTAEEIKPREKKSWSQKTSREKSLGFLKSTGRK
jgi:hypothetical protein